MFDPNLVQQYKDAFSKCYPDIPVKVVPAYKQGNFKGYKVFLRGAGDYGQIVIGPARFRAAIQDFLA